jgi:hypothetical protein
VVADEEERRRRAQEIRTRRNRAAAASRASDERAFSRWERGEVVPHLITMALDLRELHGPEVDVACGAREPDVDRWETGELYPSWEQLRALAALTKMIPEFFTRRDGLDDGPTRIWICDRNRPSRSRLVEVAPPVLEFTPAALAARPSPYGTPAPSAAAVTDLHGQTALFNTPGSAP